MLGRVALLAGLTAAGLSASAFGNDGKVFQLKHPAPRVGDAFAIDQESSLVLQTVGGPEKGHMQTKSSYAVKVTAKAGDGFVTRFELQPTTTTSDLTGKRETQTDAARTLEATLETDELQLVPAPRAQGEKAASAESFVGVKQSVSLGDTWTREGNLAVTSDVSVPLKSTYKVASAEKDAHGKDLLKVVLETSGTRILPGTGGIRINVTGKGQALIDPERADRPVEVKLTYRFVTSGGPGADSETRTETTIRTRELASVAAVTSSQENAR